MSRHLADRSALRSFIEDFASTHSLRSDITLFTSYVSALVNRGVPRSGMVRDLRPLVHDHTDQFVDGLLRILRSSDPPPPSAPPRDRGRSRPPPVTDWSSITFETGTLEDGITHQPKLGRPRESDSRSSDDTSIKRRRYIIYVAGVDEQLNTIHHLFKHFSAFGSIRTIQINRAEQFALVEFFDLKSAYLAVVSKRPVFNNRLIRVGFAAPVDENEIRLLDQQSESMQQRQTELKFTIDESSASSSDEG